MIVSFLKYTEVMMASLPVTITLVLNLHDRARLLVLVGEKCPFIHAAVVLVLQQRTADHL